jgi:DNA-binding NarL/FixJ family response regulator
MDFEHVATNPAPMVTRALPEVPNTESQSDNLQRLWSGLKNGTLSIIQTDTQQTHVSLRLVKRIPSRTARIAPGRVESIFEAALCGRLQKSIALDFEIASSTVCNSLRIAMHRIGLNMPFTRVPLALPLLAQAARRPHLVSAEVYGDLPEEPGSVCMVHLGRTDPRLANALGPCELAVASLLLEGKSYKEIHCLRRTAVRTIANQLGAVGSKFGTRGRFDLLRASLDGPAA